nr:MAG TPA: tail tube protein [Caudoviricetes sp.]
MEIFEFRGVDNLFVAKVTQDDDKGFICETPVKLSAVAEIGKTTDSSNDSKYYDNQPVIVIDSEGEDKIKLTIAPPELQMLSDLIGRSFDATTGMMVESKRNPAYYALMYRTKGTDGKYRYVSRLKGRFNIPEETNQTEDSGTNSNNTAIEFTGIYTNHEFTKGVFDGENWVKGTAKGIVVDARYGLADVSKFFDEIQTPDTVKVKE